MAVAVVRALGLAAGEDWPPQTVADLALEAERAVHGQASGIDTAVAAFGIPIRFQEGRAQPLALAGTLDLLIADSGTRGSTAEMVAAVRERQARQPQVHTDWFDRIGRLADDAVRSLAQGSSRILGQLMNTNHLLLQALEVSSPELDRLVAAARAGGALGAKLTGSGGGGAIIVLAMAEDVADLGRALTEAGAVSVQALRLGG
jgi:mevalonate kinase